MYIHHSASGLLYNCAQLLVFTRLFIYVKTVYTLSICDIFLSKRDTYIYIYASYISDSIGHIYQANANARATFWPRQRQGSIPAPQQAPAENSVTNRSQNCKSQVLLRAIRQRVPAVAYHRSNRHWSSKLKTYTLHCPADPGGPPPRTCPQACPLRDRGRTPIPATNGAPGLDMAHSRAPNAPRSLFPPLCGSVRAAGGL